MIRISSLADLSGSRKRLALAWKTGRAGQSYHIIRRGAGGDRKTRQAVYRGLTATGNLSTLLLGSGSNKRVDHSDQLLGVQRFLEELVNAVAEARRHLVGVR